MVNVSSVYQFIIRDDFNNVKPRHHFKTSFHNFLLLVLLRVPTFQKGLEPNEKNQEAKLEPNSNFNDFC